MTNYGPGRPGIGFKLRTQTPLTGHQIFFHRCGRCDRPILKDEGVIHRDCFTPSERAAKPVKPTTEGAVDNL